MAFNIVIQTHYKDIPLHVDLCLLQRPFSTRRTEQSKKQEDHSNLRLHAGTSDSLTAQIKQN